MARTKKRPSGILSPPLPTRVLEQRSILLQLMGFAKYVSNDGDAASSDSEMNPNWPAVLERLRSHPNEAAISLRFVCPLSAALSIRSDPLTEEVAEALVRCHPEPVMERRNRVMCVACENPETRPEVMRVLRSANPTYLLRGRERTRTFQLMGFSAAISELPTINKYYNKYGRTVDWSALEHHLTEHPEEASILNPGWSQWPVLFPLEAALYFHNVPLSTVELLLALCPAAATICDSSVLYLACSERKREDAGVIRAILRANPALAASVDHCVTTMGEQGPPITEAVHLPCAAEIVPDLLRAAPLSISSENQLGDTALRVAAQQFPHCGTDLLRVLLEAGHGVAGGAKGQLLSVGEYGEETAMNRILEVAMHHHEGWSLNTDAVDHHGHADTAWQNLCLALRAAGAFRTGMSTDHMWNYPLLQAAIEFGRNMTVFEKIYRERNATPGNDDLIQRDALGRTPLRVAIELAGDQPENDDRWEEMSIGTIIDLLLDDGGSSASATLPIEDSNNCTTLPLHYALRHGMEMEDGLRRITNAFAGALSIPDEQTNLIPCLLAAVGERARVGTIFELIMSRPNLIVEMMSSTLINDNK